MPKKPVTVDRIFANECSTKQEWKYCADWLKMHTSVPISLPCLSSPKYRTLHPAYADTMLELLHEIKLKGREDMPRMLLETRYTKLDRQFILHLLESIGDFESP